MISYCRPPLREEKTLSPAGRRFLKIALKATATINDYWLEKWTIWLEHEISDDD